VPAVNVIMFLVVLALILTFRSSDALAAAFGFAVTSTMVLTTLMIGYVMFRIWRVRLIWGAPVYAILLAFDLSLFAASATKIPDGAWLPLCIAAIMTLLFTTWSRGVDLMIASLGREPMSVDQFLKANADVARVPGLAVYLTRQSEVIPTALPQNLRHNHVLHEFVLLLTIQTAHTPRVPVDQRLHFEEAAPGMGRAVLTFGFFDEPDVPAALRSLPDQCRHDPDDTTYVVSRLLAIPGAHPGMYRWRAGLFGIMLRLAGSATEYFRLPPSRVVELGIEVEI
jgi:KUP system potassium uptake protein